jgi:hypothetical protein
MGFILKISKLKIIQIFSLKAQTKRESSKLWERELTPFEFEISRDSASIDAKVAYGSTGGGISH